MSTAIKPPDPPDAETGPAANADQFRMLVENVRDYAIYLMDPSGRVATWNVGAERIKGYTADEIIGKHCSLFYPEIAVRGGICEREFAAARRDGRFEDEGWRVRKDGTQFWAHVVIGAIHDDDGNLVGFSKVTRDLTARRAAERERAARLAAEEANRDKDEFLALLGHELRNPLAPIVTALALMKLQRGDAVPRELAIIERQVTHMGRLVDDLLDVSRLTRGDLKLSRGRVDLGEVVRQSLDEVAPLIEEARHHVAVDLPTTPVIVDGDRARLVQIVTNLVVNAAKYTRPEGHLAIAVRAAADVAVIEVRDDGVGIDPVLLPRIFDRFVQGPQGVDRAAGGLGLGLTLVRSLATLHGGRVVARSAGVGAGSSFEVSLPLPAEEVAVARTATPIRRVAADARGRRILLVDDNEDALEVMAAVLTTIGHEVQSALDPAEAIAIARTFRPEVAVLDIGLPVMDGYELAARLREELGEATPRLIALTGYGQPSDRARSEAAGFAVHLVKPIDMKRLLASLEPG
ncbi:MAG: ATP-binding protein [Kofleriaceae bacterium]